MVFQHKLAKVWGGGQETFATVAPGDWVRRPPQGRGSQGRLKSKSWRGALGAAQPTSDHGARIKDVGITGRGSHRTRESQGWESQGAGITRRWNHGALESRGPGITGRGNHRGPESPGAGITERGNHGMRESRGAGIKGRRNHGAQESGFSNND